jgi:hypothetical protein
MDSHFLDVGTSWNCAVSFTPRPLYLRERTTGTHWIRGRVNPRACLEDVEKKKFLTPPGLELRPLGRPARSQSLYRLLWETQYGAQNLWDVMPSSLLKFTDVSEEGTASIRIEQ